MNPTGLELIVQLGKQGWRLIGVDSSKYGNIGYKAIDLSFSELDNQPYGATGDFSIAAGKQVASLGIGALAFGDNTRAESDYSNALGKDIIVTGIYTTAVGSENNVSGEGTLVSGVNNSVAADYSFVAGEMNDIGGSYNNISGRSNTTVSTINETTISGSENNITGTSIGLNISGQKNIVSDKHSVGELEIPQSLLTGTYYLKAYTKYITTPMKRRNLNTM